MQLQMPCLVILRESPSKDFWGLTFSSLTLISLSLTVSAFHTSSILSPLHKIRVCGTFFLPQFWDTFRSNFADGPRKPALVDEVEAVKTMRRRQSEPVIQGPIIRTKHHLLEGWEDSDGVLHHQDLLYVIEIIRAELTSRHHDYLLAGGSEPKRPFDWPRILLAIIVTFGHCDAASKLI